MSARLILVAITVLASASSNAAKIKIVDQDGNPVTGAAIVATRPEIFGTEISASVEIAQEDYEFRPKYTIAHVNQPVHFPNRDRAKHHVYSFSPGNSFELKLYVGLPVEPVAFSQAGIVTLGCNIHDWMNAYVYVVDGPSAELTDNLGEVALIDAIPVPDSLTVMHPRKVRDSAKSATMEGDDLVLMIQLERPVARPQKPETLENSLQSFVEPNSAP